MNFRLSPVHLLGCFHLTSILAILFYFGWLSFEISLIPLFIFSLSNVRKLLSRRSASANNSRSANAWATVKIQFIGLEVLLILLQRYGILTIDWGVVFLPMIAYFGFSVNWNFNLIPVISIDFGNAIWIWKRKWKKQLPDNDTIF